MKAILEERLWIVVMPFIWKSYKGMAFSRVATVFIT